MEIPQMVRKIRGERTRQEFARDIGVSRQSVTWWEEGRFTPTKDWLDKLGIKLTAAFVDSKPERTYTIEE